MGHKPSREKGQSPSEAASRQLAGLSSVRQSRTSDSPALTASRLARELKPQVVGVNTAPGLAAPLHNGEHGFMRHDGGITVAGTPQRGAVLARTRDLLEFAHQHGFGRDEIIQILALT